MLDAAPIFCGVWEARVMDKSTARKLARRLHDAVRRELQVVQLTRIRQSLRVLQRAAKS